MSLLHHSKAHRKSFLSVIILLVRHSFVLSALLVKTIHEMGLQHCNIQRGQENRKLSTCCSMVEFPNYSGPPFIFENPKLRTNSPVERRIDCDCHYCCKRKQIPPRLGWATTIHRCQGITVEKSEVNMYIVISPVTRKFESINPGALWLFQG